MWRKVAAVLAICALTVAGALVDADRAMAAHTITFDATRYHREWPRVEQYINTSTRYAPPTTLAAKVESRYGRPKIARVWLTLDEMWDYRTGEYFYNFKIGYNRYVNDPNHYDYDWAGVRESNVYFYDYLQSLYDHADELLLNVRRYEADVINGTVTWAKYKQVLKNGIRHYKQRYPGLRYIEALNEAEVPSFGGLNDDQIYQFYKVFYDVVNELNTELNPDVPLLLGGPASTRHGRAMNFISRYAADTNPAKKLDFISFHDYSSSEGSHKKLEAHIDVALAAAGLPTDLPVFVDELGYTNPTTSAADNLRNASRVARALYWASEQPGVHVFPWVTYHNPNIQLSLLQFHTTDLKTTPNAAMIEALRMHKRYQIWSNANVTNTFFANATIDESGVAVMATNQDADSAQNINVTIRSLPALFDGSGFVVKKYLIDSSHSNALTDSSYTGGLELVSTTSVTVTGDLTLTHSAVETYGIVFWVVEPVTSQGTFPEPDPLTSIGPVGYGVAATDSNVGLGYIMYSQQNVFTRFGDVYAGNSDHLVAVKYENGSWWYDNNSTWVSFTPVSSDLLVAEVDFSADTIKVIDKGPGTSGGRVMGVRSGVCTSALRALANVWEGGTNAGEFTLEGLGFIPCATYAASTIIDDPQLSYSGMWAASTTDPNYYNQTKHVSNTAGSTATVTFQGSGVRLYLRQVSNAGMFDVYVNGVKQATVDAYSPSSHNRVLAWRMSGLSPDSTTTVQIKLNGQKKPSSPNYYVGLDFFEIDA